MSDSPDSDAPVSDVTELKEINETEEENIVDDGSDNGDEENSENSMKDKEEEEKGEEGKEEEDEENGEKKEKKEDLYSNIFGDESEDEKEEDEYDDELEELRKKKPVKRTRKKKEKGETKPRKKRKLSPGEEFPEDKPKKAKKRSGRSEEQILDSVLTLLSKMREAHDKDMELFRASKPSLQKLNILRDVETLLPNTIYQKCFIDNNALNEIGRWMTPMPDKSLPNIRVREVMLKVLNNLSVNNMSPGLIQESGVGKFVKLYSVHPKETNPNRTLAENILNKWMQYIFERGDDYPRYREEVTRVGISKGRKSSGKPQLGSSFKKKN